MNKNFNTETEELKKICTPVIEYLKDNGNPYTKLIISVDSIELVVTGVGIPLDSKND